MTQFLTVIVGLILVGFISWWFFGQRKAKVGHAKMTKNIQEVTIEVNGGYSPETIILKQNVPAKLNFIQNDTTACLSHVVFPEFGINQDLSQRKETKIDLDTSKAGEYGFVCGMGMFHGKVIIAS